MIGKYKIDERLIVDKPRLKSDPEIICLTQNVLKNLQCLIAIAKKQLLKHNLLKVKLSLTIIRKVYENGNEMVRNAKENLFKISLSRVINKCRKEAQELMHSIIPPSLKNLC